MNKSYGRWGRWGATASASVASAPVSSSASSHSTVSSVSSVSVPTSATAASVMTSLFPSSGITSSSGTTSSSGVSSPYTQSSYNPYMDSGVQYQAPGSVPTFDEDDDDTRYVGEGDDGPGNYADDDGDNDYSDRRGRMSRMRAKMRKHRRRRRESYAAPYGTPYGSTAGEILGRGTLFGRNYYKKAGSGGYVYLQFTDNGGIKVDESSPDRKGAYLPAFTTPQWYAISQEIGPLASQKAKVTAYYKAHAAQVAAAAKGAAPTSVIITGQSHKGINALFAALGGGDPKVGGALVAKAAVDYGPDVATSAQEFLSSKSDSPAAIQKKIDKLKVKLAAAKAKGDKVKVKKLQARIKGLQAKLATLNAQGGDITATSEMGMSTFPWKWVLGGVVGFIVLMVAVKAAKGGRATAAA